MRFILTYRGLLPSSGNRQDKHNIRKQFHPQLKRQWEIDECLSQMQRVNETVRKETAPSEFLNATALEIQRGAFSFIPLVTKHLHLVCSLDITMLRPEAPGQLIRHGGDIDNRMKTLFDSLRVPDESEVSGLSPDLEETPFYCLLENDSLVASLQVKTERLLRPVTEKPVSEVEMLIAVVVRPTMIVGKTLKFLGGWLS
jgi:hypothetical protein